jgi:hypothetical protein
MGKSQTTHWPTSLEGIIQILVLWFSNLFCAVLRSGLFAALRRITIGQIVIQTEKGEQFVFGDQAEPVLRATLRVKDEIRFLTRVVSQWDLGFVRYFT